MMLPLVSLRNPARTWRPNEKSKRFNSGVSALAKIEDIRLGLMRLVASKKEMRSQEDNAQSSEPGNKTRSATAAANDSSDGKESTKRRKDEKMWESQRSPDL